MYSIAFPVLVFQLGAMVYGFGSSENNWEAVAVQTLKQ